MRSLNFINNRMHMAKHPSQGDFKKVLFCCSGGLLRSATAAQVFAMKPYNFNTRCVGLQDKYALIPISDVLIHWADEIVCMDQKHLHLLRQLDTKNKPIKCLGISDDFIYREGRLIELLKQRYEETPYES